MSNTAPKQSKIKRAFFALFETEDDFTLFENDQIALGGSSKKLLQYAYETDFIKQTSRIDFIAALKNRIPQEFDTTPPDSFDTCINSIRNKISIRQLIEKINSTGNDIDLIATTPAMFTRLKANFKSDSPAKRNALRSLIWWTTLNRTEQRLSFETLCNIPVSIVPQTPPNEGVLLVVALQSPYALIPTNAIRWLRDELKEIIHDLHLSPEISSENIRELGATAVSLRFIRVAGINDSFNLYTHAINSAIAISHQMIVRWSLSEYARIDRNLCITINAGNFDIIQPETEAILSFSPIRESRIIATDFAYQCAKNADAKVSWKKL